VVIPADWAWKTLGDVTSLIPGGVYGEEFPRTQLIGMPVATTAHIEMSDRWNSKEMNIRYFSKEHVQTYAPQFGDLIVVKSSGSAASIQSGKLGFVDQNRAGKFIFSNFLMLLRPLNICPKFLYFYVSSNNVKRLIPTLVEASTYPNIRIPEYLEVQICVPPLKEQEVIAEALSDADAAIESLDALIAKKRDVKQATMQQLLTGRTRLPGFTADWKEVRLGEHAAFFKGNGLSKSQLIDDGSQLCVHYGELFTHYGPVIETVTSKCVAFEGSFKSLAGDVLMPGSDVTPRGLATASAIKFSDVVLGGDIIVIRTKPTSLYGPFLSNFIRMSKGRVLRLVKGSTVYHIHAKDLADLEVLMPPLKEQEAIAEALTVMDDELETLNEQVSKLRMVKEGMMQDLLTGKVRLV